MTHKIVTIPKRTSTAAFPDVQQLLQHRRRAALALALAAIVAANNRAVIVLSNTAAEVDTAANRLLVGEQAWISSQ
jgi:hypothetical protein